MQLFLNLLLIHTSGPLPKDIPARQLMSPTIEKKTELSPPDTFLSYSVGPPNNIARKPPDFDDEYDLNNGDDLEIVMITRDAELGDMSSDDESGRSSIPLVNHNHFDVHEKETLISDMKENNVIEFNARLRMLAVRELRKPGKSKLRVASLHSVKAYAAYDDVKIKCK
jgi:hypothetical protein